MEPQGNNLDRLPSNSPENVPKTPESGSEIDRNKKIEHLPIGALESLNEGVLESNQGVNQQVQAATDAATTLPTVPQPSSNDDTSVTNISSSTPAVAADDDVIEKEWVNKAKKVINQTKGDPYAKEREVSKLQADYMQKRYGKQVKMPDDN